MFLISFYQESLFQHVRLNILNLCYKANSYGVTNFFLSFYCIQVQEKKQKTSVIYISMCHLKEGS